ncbi:MAG: DUF1631 domain-containing protein [Burkholderiaceae bacterium]|jgi:hypothetical protein|nr:DUF1631 domain-containing protein [Burkholderiaceae bacterium]
MSPAASPFKLTNSAARRARELFVNTVDTGTQELADLIGQRLTKLVADAKSIEMLRAAQDAENAFARKRAGWVKAVSLTWRAALDNKTAAPQRRQDSRGGTLGLVADDVIERQLLASRLAHAVHDKALWEINALEVRIRHLEHIPELAASDVFQPRTYPRALLDAWATHKLALSAWALVQDSVYQPLAERMTAAYRRVNEHLIGQGVLPEIDLKDLVRRADSGPASGAEPPASHKDKDTARNPPQGRQDERRARTGGSRQEQEPESAGGGRAQPWYRRPLPGGGGQRMGVRLAASAKPFEREAGAGHVDAGHVTRVHSSALARADQETRMMTRTAAPVRLRERAQGVLGQLRRLLIERVAGYDAAAPAVPISPALLSSLMPSQPPAYAPTMLLAPPEGGPAAMAPPTSPQAAAQQLRRRATELKTKTNRPSEKAIIEIVALMFQAILAEEHIPAALRIWFARLQIPVLRLALAEPDFFASTGHPARQLIDRMGACAMGFDAQGIAGSRLEREIKRVVQVIEQYPETGRRVFQLVLDEFRKFLGRSLTEGSPAQQAVTLAQQVEQRDALAIQYTIELRKMLAPVTLDETVRDFLFHIWSEVLAMATVRLGARHATTQAYKQAAAGILWAISPKPDRGSVAQRLPQLLQTLREGMTTVGIVEAEQDHFIKQINDAVMQAFVSHGEGIAPEKLDELARSLAHLESVVTDDAEGDVMLDPDTLELMFGVDASSMSAIATGGTEPGQAMLAWAAELELGNWFMLEFSGATLRVQYVWRSARGQLHLFASAGGKTYLVQTTRLASYLQAGLLTPLEEEPLTARATRDALTRLQAAPEQLMN